MPRSVYYLQGLLLLSLVPFITAQNTAGNMTTTYPTNNASSLNDTSAESANESENANGVDSYVRYRNVYVANDVQCVRDSIGTEAAVTTTTNGPRPVVRIVVPRGPALLNISIEWGDKAEFAPETLAVNYKTNWSMSYVSPEWAITSFGTSSSSVMTQWTPPNFDAATLRAGASSSTDLSLNTSSYYVVAPDQSLHLYHVYNTTGIISSSNNTQNATFYPIYKMIQYLDNFTEIEEVTSFNFRCREQDNVWRYGDWNNGHRASDCTTPPLVPGVRIVGGSNACEIEPRPNLTAALPPTSSSEPSWIISNHHCIVMLLCSLWMVLKM